MKMKKIISAIAALAMTVSAFAGITAQAEDVYTNVYTNECITTDNWSSPNGQVVADETNACIYAYGTGSGNRSAMFTFPSEVTGITEGRVALSFDFKFSDNVGTANRSYAQIALLDDNSTVAAGNNGVVSGDSVIWSLTSTQWTSTRNDTYYTSDNAENTFTVTKSVWYTLNAEINYNSGVMSISVVNKGTGAELCSSNISAPTVGLQNLYILSPRYNTSRSTYVDNILVSTIESTGAVETAVTVNKVDTEGNVLDSKIITGVNAGEAYVANSDEKASFYKLGDGVKYVYTYTETGSTASIDALSETAEDNVITLVFDMAEKAAVTEATVNYNYNGETILTETKTLTDVYVGDVVTIGFKRYILVDGVLYESPQKGTNGFYRNNVTLSADIVIDIDVSAETKISAVGEVIAVVEGSGTSADNTGVRASEGEATRGTITVGTVEAGSYKIYNRSYKRGGDTWVKLDGTVVTALNVHNGSWADGDVTNVQIPTSGELTVGPGSSSSDYVDYVVVVKTGEYEAAPALTSEAQFAEQEDATGTLRFKSMVSDKDFESSNYGFILVNFADADADTTTPDGYDETATGITQKNVDFAGDVATDSVFYHDIQNIPNTATGMGFYAVPYVISAEGNLECYYGSPFTYTGAFNWSTAE